MGELKAACSDTGSSNAALYTRSQQGKATRDFTRSIGGRIHIDWVDTKGIPQFITEPEQSNITCTPQEISHTTGTTIPTVILRPLSDILARIEVTRVTRLRSYGARLAAVIEGRDGAQVGAIDETLAQQKRATITIPKPVRATGMAIG